MPANRTAVSWILPFSFSRWCLEVKSSQVKSSQDKSSQMLRNISWRHKHMVYSIHHYNSKRESHQIGLDYAKRLSFSSFGEFKNVRVSRMYPCLKHSTSNIHSQMLTLTGKYCACLHILQCNYTNCRQLFCKSSRHHWTCLRSPSEQNSYHRKHDDNK